MHTHSIAGVAVASQAEGLLPLNLNSMVFHERLAYPITQIPLLMTEPGGALYRSPLLWLGFTLAAGVNVLNALNMLYPNVPAFPVKRQAIVLDGWSRPWSALNPIYYSLNPFLVGLEFFLPLDLLFSAWFLGFR